MFRLPKPLWILIGALLSCQMVSAQFSGYYIKISGDTVRGSFPDFRIRNNNPSKVNFEPATGSRITLEPGNAKSFHVNFPVTYVSFNGQRLTNSLKADNSFGSSEDTYSSIPTFLKVIGTKGIFTFYSFTDDDRSNLFYSGKDDRIIELKQKIIQNNNVPVKTNEYQEQLAELFPEENRQTISRIIYSEDALAGFVGTRRRANDPGQKAVNSSKGIVITVGASYNNLSVTAPNTSLYASNDFKSNVKPLLTLGYILPLDRARARIFFYPQIRVFAFDHTAKASYTSNSLIFISNYKSSPVISLAANAGLNVVNTDQIKVQLIAGIGFAYLSNNKRTEKVENGNGTGSTTVEKYNQSPGLVNFTAQAIVRNRFVVWAGPNLPMHIANDSRERVLKTAQAGIGIKF